MHIYTASIRDHRKLSPAVMHNRIIFKTYDSCIIAVLCRSENFNCKHFKFNYSIAINTKIKLYRVYYIINFSRFGAACRRTPEQVAAAKAHAEKVIADIDHDTTLVAYTDGAAQGNPGPTGAGAIVTYLCSGPAASRHTEVLSVGLGTSTNNYGELWAIGMVLADVAQKARDGYELPVQGVILTDNPTSGLRVPRRRLELERA